MEYNYSEVLDSVTALNGHNELHIFVINYNNLGYTRDVVADLLANEADFDLTVLDQCSVEDGTQEYLDTLSDTWRGERRQLNIVRNNANTPLNWVWNWFAERAVGAKYLCYLNNDIRLPRNFVSDTIEIFHKEPNCGIVVHSTNIVTSKMSGELSYMKMRGNHMQGWDFTIRRDVYTLIDRNYEIFYGDDWLFSHVYEQGYDVFGCYSSPILHYANRTIRKRTDIRSIYENEGKLWACDPENKVKLAFDILFSVRVLNEAAIKKMEGVICREG